MFYFKQDASSGYTGGVALRHRTPQPHLVPQGRNTEL